MIVDSVFRRTTCSSWIRMSGAMSVLVVLCLSWGGGLEAEDRATPLLDEAFRKYGQRAGLLVQGEVLISDVPCGGELCMGLSLSGAPRDAAVKQLAQLASGFGYGAMVEEMRFKAAAQNYLEVSVSVVVKKDRRESSVESLARRAEELSAFLRVLARMSEAYREEFNPRKVAADRKLYFIDEFFVLDGGNRMSARLLGPSAAGAPERRGKAATGEAFTIRVTPAGEVEQGSFAGWKAYRVDWKRK